MLFALADARRDGLIPVARATDAEVIEASERAERQLEEACGVALTRKTATHEGIVNARGVLTLPHRQAPWAPDAIVVLSSVPATPAGALRAYRWGAVSGWTTGEGRVVTVTYQHGPVVPPARAMVAALTLARSQLLEGPIDSRALGIAVEGGGSIGLATPGMRGATFGIPEVDAFIGAFGVGRRV